ncbi:hypothetical protein IWX46DRAFT_604252 [Phyllosticta citricarpa]|uniref:Uncharacterized protein n=1 Tax=Phyllosticta citricarpa TaxID=55181 RepID=A0ABR1M5X8_9PEZI
MSFWLLEKASTLVRLLVIIFCPAFILHFPFHCTDSALLLFFPFPLHLRVRDALVTFSRGIKKLHSPFAESHSLSISNMCSLPITHPPFTSRTNIPQPSSSISIIMTPEKSRSQQRDRENSSQHRITILFFTLLFSVVVCRKSSRICD